MICRSLLAEEEGCRYFARFKLHNSCLRFLTTQGCGGLSGIGFLESKS